MVSFMWPHCTLGTIMVPKNFIFKTFVSRAFYRHVTSIFCAFWIKMNANSNASFFFENYSFSQMKVVIPSSYVSHKKCFSRPPERLMVLWPNSLSWEDFLPILRCQIVRGWSILTTPASQSSEFSKKCNHIFEIENSCNSC